MRGLRDHPPDAQLLKAGSEPVRIPDPTDSQVATAKRREKSWVDSVGTGHHLRQRLVLERKNPIHLSAILQ